MITLSQSRDGLEKMVEAFRRGGGEGKPIFLQAKHAYAEADEAAREDAFEQWRTNIFGSAIRALLHKPAEFDQAAFFAKPENMDAHARISSDRYAAWLQGDLELGFDAVYVHNVGREQAAFIEAFGRRVLPELGGAQ